MTKQGSFRGERVRGAEQPLLDRVGHRGDQPAGALEAGPRRAQIRVEVERAVELDLEGVDAALRPPVPADDIAARIRRVARRPIAQRPRGGDRGVEQVGG